MLQLFTLLSPSKNLTVSITMPSTATTEQHYDERPQWTTLSVEQCLYLIVTAPTTSAYV